MKTKTLSDKQLRTIAHRLLRDLGLSDFANPAPKEMLASAIESIRSLTLVQWK